MKPTRRLRTAAVLALAVPVLSSCGTNFYPPTDMTYTPAIGVNDRSESVDVLNALVVTETDGSGTLVASLVNNDIENDDRLTQVTGSGGDSNLEVQGSPVDVPAGELVGLLEESQATVTGTKVRPGFFVELRFTFEGAEPVTVQAPVVSNTGAFEEIPVP